MNDEKTKAEKFPSAFFTLHSSLSLLAHSPIGGVQTPAKREIWAVKYESQSPISGVKKNE